MKTKSFIRRTTCLRTVAGRLIIARAASLLLLLTFTSAAQAQFTYTTNNGTLTITGYHGPGGAVSIPSTIDGLPVTIIGDAAFYNGGPLQPYVLTSIMIPDGVTTIGNAAFAWMGNLSRATLGNGLRSIGGAAFANCSLTAITIPGGVTNVGDFAFAYCDLTAVVFQGNAPHLGTSVFEQLFGANNATVYYLPGTTGWLPSFGGCPTVLWDPQIHTFDPDFVAQANKFGFIITGTPNTPTVIEACTNLVSAVWFPLQSCTLTNGFLYFSDPQWTSYPGRFYRIRPP